TTLTTQQVSIMKYWKLWQPLVDKEGTLAKVDSNDAALNLKSNPDSDVNDGLDLEQTIEGQYTILFLGMDESGELSDVDWVLQFDLIAGSMNILQIPRDSYMPDYASYSTTKFNSIYHSGQETGVTPIQRVVNAIQENFCIYVDAYVKLNCVDIANIVDSVGGIPITLPEQITYEADKILPAGEQTLNGQQSEWFVRFRHGYAEGDIGRVKAQRIFLAAAMEKMLNMSQTELMSAMQKIYKNQWIATDLSLEQISMVETLPQRLTGQCQRSWCRKTTLSGGRLFPVGVFYSQVCNCGSAEPVFPPLSERDLSGGKHHCGTGAGGRVSGKRL
ncbi:MAG: LCP family protein, partial [Ruminococcus callidus]